MTAPMLPDSRTMDVGAVTEGIHAVPATEYHASIGVSSSALKHLKRSPLAFLTEKTNPTPATAAMRLGSAIHTAVLEPELFESQFFKRTRHHAKKIGGLTEAEEHPRKEALATSDAHTIECIVEAFQSEHEMATLARNIIENGRKQTPLGIEPALYVQDTETMLWRRGRPDIGVWDGGVMVELKTTKDGTHREFRNTMARLGYHRQAAWNLKLAEDCGHPCSQYLFIVVETSPPFEIRVYELDEEALDQGRKECNKLWSLYVECCESNEWPAAQQEPETIGLPTWAMYDD